MKAGERFDAATLATLEYPVVIERIAARATCAPGTQAVRALRPRTDTRWMRHELDLVDDAIALFEAGGDFGFGGVVDVTPAIERAAVGSTLAAPELESIAGAERALARAARAITDHNLAVDHKGRPLHELTRGRCPTDALIRRLETSIEDGALADGASPELARLRRQQRALADEIRKRVDDIVRNPNTAKLLSEELVTMRSGRYVVPVRAEHSAQLPGVVHAQSASGATIFIEPMACVEANNRLRGLEAAEERETQRILAELSALVAADAQALHQNAALVAALDAVGARARWARDVRALAPALVSAHSVRIVAGRHPLLRKTAVPLDVSVGIDADAVIISGPNMGGKTVVLKTIGLFCLLAYAGIPLPAGPGTEIGVFDHIACAVGDEQSIANDLSSFSAHLRALSSAQSRAGSGSLVLVDEIGNGTEPGAGAALAQAFVESLLRAGARVVVTTHFSQLKIFAAAHDRVANASMLFDPQTHRPTYTLAMGVPGQSLAFALAHTIGMDPQTIARAEELLGSEARDLERAFKGLAAERERLRSQAEDVSLELARLRAVETELRERIAAAEKERASFERSAAQALERAVQSVREELIARTQRGERDAQRQRARLAGEEQRTMQETMAEIRRSLGLEGGSTAEPAPDAFAPGDAVYVRSFGQRGVVSEVYDRDVLVTIGNVKAVMARNDLTRDPAALRESGSASHERNARRSSPGESYGKLASLDASTSVDVRGMRVDEAMPVVDKALDDASLAGLAALRIIHGKGTGQLGRGIRAFLKDHAQVKSFENAADREGGSGVTVVTLR